MFPLSIWRALLAAVVLAAALAVAVGSNASAQESEQFVIGAEPGSPPTAVVAQAPAHTKLKILQITARMGRRFTNFPFSYGPNLVVKVPRSVAEGRVVRIENDCVYASPPTVWGKVLFGETRIREYYCNTNIERPPRRKITRALRPSYTRDRKAANRGACRWVNRKMYVNKRRYRLPCRGIWWARGGPLSAGAPPVLIFNYGECPAGRPWAVKEAILYHRQTLPSELQIGLLDVRFCGKRKEHKRETGLWLNRNYRKYVRRHGGT